MRIGVPDYNNLKDRPCLQKGKDSQYPAHIALTSYIFTKAIISETLFRRYKFYHYWDKDEFGRESIDYSVGMVKRTPDNDLRNKRTGIVRKLNGIFKDLKFKVS